MKSLADFRKFLAQSGATVQIVKHDWAAQGRGSFNARPGFFEARKVAKLQTNAVKFENGSWLDWRHGAKWFRFDGSHTVVYSLSSNAGVPMSDAIPDFKDVIVYKC